MIGNVWEWTADRYLPRGELQHHEAGDRSPSCDDREGTTAHVIKGGSYLCSPNFCARYRVSARHAHDPTLPTSHIGFRTVVRDRGRTKVIKLLRQNLITLGPLPYPLALGAAGGGFGVEGF